jgi:hypothetical protein
MGKDIFMGKLDKSVYELNSKTPDIKWVREFGTILARVDKSLGNRGFSVSLRFKDADCREAFMRVSRDDVSHEFSMKAKGRITPFTAIYSDSLKLCPRIAISIPGKVKEKFHEVTKEEYDRTSWGKRAGHFWTFSKYRIL